MKALTICQPYAHLIIATREKRVENRTWWTSYRGKLAIHAGLSKQWLSSYSPLPEGMVFGAVIGTVLLVDCVKLLEAHDKYPWTRQHVHAEGPYCWILEKPEPFAQPAFCRGAQQLWEWNAAAPATETLFG